MTPMRSRAGECARDGCTRGGVWVPVVHWWARPEKGHPAAKFAVVYALHCHHHRDRANDQKRQVLDELTHPAIRARIEEQMDRMGHPRPDWSTTELHWAHWTDPVYDPDSGFTVPGQLRALA